ncbi:MAG: hypothetical protein Q7T11_04160, partial [Deltaproteobacteria bacterium]|nr:hypothetical protein [Deltaproteobacteria bacterium]
MDEKINPDAPPAGAATEDKPAEALAEPAAPEQPPVGVGDEFTTPVSPAAGEGLAPPVQALFRGPTGGEPQKFEGDEVLRRKIKTETVVVWLPSGSQVWQQWVDFLYGDKAESFQTVLQPAEEGLHFFPSVQALKQRLHLLAARQARLHAESLLPETSEEADPEIAGSYGIEKLKDGLFGYDSGKKREVIAYLKRTFGQNKVKQENHEGSPILIVKIGRRKIYLVEKIAEEKPDAGDQRTLFETLKTLQVGPNTALVHLLNSTSVEEAVTLLSTLSPVFDLNASNDLLEPLGLALIRHHGAFLLASPHDVVEAHLQAAHLGSSLEREILMGELSSSQMIQLAEILSQPELDSHAMNDVIREIGWSVNKN